MWHIWRVLLWSPHWAFFGVRPTHDQDGKPYIVVECKDVFVPLTQAVFEQAARYNYILKAPYLIVVNGLTYHCCRIDHASQTYQFLEDIPRYTSPIHS